MKIKFKGKIIEARKCEGIFDKARGLMFRTKSPALIFQFDKPGKHRIHSFFCKPFHAVWMLGEKIVDEKTINSWKFSILPKQEFDRLVEIPVGLLASPEKEN